ncbi:hypothetical protein BT96DRAFT_1002557 [Gymnopus androsaceus JB14]|uniref:Uncharacterized protein n=1 Tax=Gymnopus androsaceus JB14 TaxID=1447944 RepID=A0A6A4GWI8_9AGAR|nr:hypothetical protein BT96DRAFT_1002557 [Gymnopus androsaceus JB14]
MFRLPIRVVAALILALLPSVSAQAVGTPFGQATGTTGGDMPLQPLHRCSQSR